MIASRPRPTKGLAQKIGFCALMMGALLICGAQTSEQGVQVTGRVELLDASTDARVENDSGAVVWLTQMSGTQAAAAAILVHQPDRRLRLAQHNKSFEPNLLIVPVGSVVEFPNQDPFFHNVFSLFEGKRFDLGLYEAGTTRNVLFDRPGISYIFCNIHPEMSAVVITLGTPYYGVSDQHGEIGIPGVPPGRYGLHVWHQSSSAEALDNLTREVAVSQNLSSLGVIRVTVSILPQTHKNKYGRDYDRPNPTSPVYDRP
jgi:plastocyanin